MGNRPFAIRTCYMDLGIVLMWVAEEFQKLNGVSESFFECQVADTLVHGQLSVEVVECFFVGQASAI
jgi:hypothetical protein